MPTPGRTLDDAIDALAARLRGAKRVVVLTGAGVSAESGLRTFRGATAADLPPDMASLWKEFDPMTLATPEAFEADPEKVSRWYDWRRLGCLAAEPNPGHLALAQLEQWTCYGSVGLDPSVSSPDPRIGAEPPIRGTPRGTFTLLTQNVDRLHQRAGSKNVVELHGSIIQWRCTVTGRKVTPEAEPFAEFPPASPFHDDGRLRPDVVWFGEALPPLALEAAFEASRVCDVFLTVGTSAVVYPAAGYVDVARSFGAFTAEVNAEETAASGRVDLTLRGKSGEVLPRVIARLASM
jgi:NAD-dependent deacetylase